MACATGVAMAAPEWVPHRWTREDGPVETAGFACFFAAAVLAIVSAQRLRSTHRRAAAVVLALSVAMAVAAGEEISWGQRLLDLDTPQVLVDGNRQDELNLHNIDGLQQRAVVAQLAVAVSGSLLPLVRRERWARAGAPFFAGYLAYRAARGVAALLDLGPADRQSEAAELLLALGFLALTGRLVRDLRRPPSALGG